MEIVLGILVGYCIASTVLVVALFRKVDRQKRLIRKKSKQLKAIKFAQRRYEVMLNKEVKAKDRIKEAYQEQLLGVDRRINKLIDLIDKLENENILVHYKGKMLLVYPSRIAVDIDDIKATEAYRTLSIIK